MQRHFTEQSIFRFFSREIGQFPSKWVRFSKDKTMRPHVNMLTSCRHYNNSPHLWLQLITKVSVGMQIRDKFKLKIARSVKTPWQEYGEVAGSWWLAPGHQNQSNHSSQSERTQTISWSHLFLSEFLFMKITLCCHNQSFKKSKMKGEIQNISPQQKTSERPLTFFTCN